MHVEKVKKYLGYPYSGKRAMKRKNSLLLMPFIFAC